MRRIVPIAVALLSSAALLFSCAEKWRGEGPPEMLEKSVWIGTNEARGEILEFRFGFTGETVREVEPDGASRESGDVRMLFTSAAGPAVRDTVVYDGSYVYSRRPSGVAGDVFHGTVRLVLSERGGDGAVREAWMVFHNMRFFFSFDDSPGSWPTDPQ